MKDLSTLLKEAGVTHINPEFIGEYIRSGESENDKPEWFIGYEKNGLKQANFGNWRLGTKGYWKSNGESLTSGDLEEMEIVIRNAKLKELERQEEISKASEKEWDSLTPINTHPYLEKKGLVSGFGVRLDAKGNLVVPLTDDTGKVWSLQRISYDGTKRFKGRMKGCFYEIKGTKKETVYITEGFATGASVHAATDSQVFVAFNAGNLSSVAASVRRLHPDTQIVIAGDNDISGVGQRAAEKAAAGCGGRAVWPERGGKDWNDIHQEEGIEKVRAALNTDGGAQVGQNNPNYSDADDAEFVIPDPEFDLLADIPILPMSVNKQGKPVLPEQSKVKDVLINHVGDNVLRYKDALFSYTGTHWKELTKQEIDAFKVAISRVCQGHATANFIESVFKMLWWSLPAPRDGVDMFSPHPFAANFKNGTLHLVRDKDHKYTLEFREHSKLDYLINVLPHNYDPGRGDKNQEFLDMLDRVFEGDKDKNEKILAIQEMYGACLVPAFPRLFMLYGPPNTGKSTLLKIASRLITKDNMSFIPPSDFHGFLMQPMAGKLVNMDTDVPTDKPISDSIVKKIIERAPMNIQRKGLANVWSHIPAVHLFGGNKIPETKDISGAHHRRWTFIEVKKVLDAGKATHKGEYWDYCYEQSPQGVLNFAIGGLERLCANGGKFTMPESGMKEMLRWSFANDAVKMFISDIKEGDVGDENNKIILDQEGTMLRSKVWEIYKQWAADTFGRNYQPHKWDVFSALRKEGFREEKKEKGWVFCGLKRVSEGGCQF